jgi:2-iminobutanoate/2-iminopropanoate deaminase
MMAIQKDVIIAKDGPRPIGPYSPGIRVGNLLFISGTIGIDPATGELSPGGVEGQTRQALVSISKILEALNANLANVVKTTVFLKDIDNFSSMNTIYAQYFSESPPARSTIEVAALPADAEVEIEAIAILD